MGNSKLDFRHESLQSTKQIQETFKAINKGLSKGTLTFTDDNGEIELQPQGLLNVKVTARQDEYTSRLDVRISWRNPDEPSSNKPLQIGHTKPKSNS